MSDPNLLAHYLEQVAALRDDIDAWEAGHREEFDHRDGERINVTPDRLAEAKERLREMEAMIEQLERSHTA